MKFSDELWEHILPIFDEIIAHPFNVELANGTLSPERFHFYMQQDARYLIDFSRALALIAARASSSRLIHPFLNFSMGALISERELHAQFLGPVSHSPTEPSFACLAYTRYLLATAATASIEEAIAAVLPCFWIYREVGRSICIQTEKNNPYALWIDTYSSQEFSDATDQAIALLDEMAGQCSAHLLALMKNAFECSSLLEWHFWEDAYNRVVFRKGVFLRNRANQIAIPKMI